VLCRGHFHTEWPIAAPDLGALSPIFAMRVDTIVQGLRYFLVDSQMMQDPDECAANYTRTDSPIPPSRAALPDPSDRPRRPEVAARARTAEGVGGRADDDPRRRQAPTRSARETKDYAVLQTGSDGTVVVTSGYSLADGSDKPDIYAPALRVWGRFHGIPFRADRRQTPDHLFHLRIATAHADSGDDDPTRPT